MTTDPSVPAELLGHHALDPRASRIRMPASIRARTEIWLGGCHTAIGSPIAAHDLVDAWVVDCSGDLPGPLVRDAARLIPRVFVDTESMPMNYDRILGLAAELAEAVRSPEAPERLYVLCQQGLNRSGLVTGRLLRALGVGGEDAVAAVRAARPGGLSNATFLGLVFE